MADLREVFPILQDDSTGAGEAPVSRVEGEVAAAKEGLIGFSFKDSGGNVVLPQLTAGGAIPVDNGATTGTCKYEYGEDASPVVATASDIATMVISLATKYERIMIAGCCTRTTLFELVYIDDVGVTDTELVIGRFLVGSGQFSYCCEALCRILDTAAGTAVQNLVLRGTNLQHASTIRGEFSAFELA